MSKLLTTGVFLIGAAVGVVAISIPTGYSSKIASDVLPGKKIEAGFVDPNDLEIIIQDGNLNGAYETIAKIGDDAFLLKYEMGNPVFKRYELKPIEK